MPNADTQRFVFVTVGTDHHPFDRLIRWIDEWLASRDGTVRCFVQSGTSPAPQRAESAEYLTYDEMEARMRSADAVVSHGGPASIILARHSGKKPIVVPRRKELGEHVDDHQAVFSRRIATEGRIALAESQDEFRALLDQATAEQLAVEADDSATSVEEAVSRFEHLVDALLRSHHKPALMGGSAQ